MKLPLLTLCVIWLLPALVPAQDNFAHKAHRAAFEVVADGKEAWDAVLNNVENLRKALGEDQTGVVVIAHGKGLGLLLKESPVRDRIDKLAEAGVVFAACENTMEKQNVAKDELLPATTTVDSGVAEVVRKQEAGWAYIKSG